MSYKDKDRQKEAQRNWVRQNRAKKVRQGQGSTVTPVTTVGESTNVTLIPARPVNYGEPDCECMHCKSNRASGGKHTINHGAYKPAHLLGGGEFNRVTLPGDVDYEGVCLTEKYKSKRIG